MKSTDLALFKPFEFAKFVSERNIDTQSAVSFDGKSGYVTVGPTTVGELRKVMSDYKAHIAGKVATADAQEAHTKTDEAN